MAGVSENVVFLVDASDSTQITYSNTSSWMQSVNLLSDYALDRSYVTSLGVVTYSTISKVDLPPTKDQILALEKISAMQPHDIGGTDIGTALTNSILLLSSQAGGNRVMLVTDGRSYFGTSISHALQLAIDNRIKVDIIKTNTERNDLKTDNVLTEISDATGGFNIYLNPSNHAEVVDFLLTLPNATAQFALSDILLIMALTLLTVEWALSKSIFKVIPHE